MVQKGDHLNFKFWFYLFSVRRVYEAGESLHGDSFIAGGRPQLNLIKPPLLRQISVPSLRDGLTKKNCCFFGQMRGGGALNKFFGTFSLVHFLSIKGVYLNQNANDLNIKLLF